MLARVKANTSSAEDREQAAHLLRVTLEVTKQLQADLAVQPPPVSERPSPKQNAKRKRQIAQAARRRQRR